MVCNVPVSCTADEDRNQLGAWLDSDTTAEYKEIFKVQSNFCVRCVDQYRYAAEDISRLHFKILFCRRFKVST